MTDVTLRADGIDGICPACGLKLSDAGTLRAALAAREAEIAKWQDKAVSLGMDNLDVAIAWGADAAQLRTTIATLQAQLASALETLKPFAAIALERDSDPTGPDCIAAPDLAITPADVRKARAAASAGTTSA